MTRIYLIEWREWWSRKWKNGEFDIFQSKRKATVQMIDYSNEFGSKYEYRVAEYRRVEKE